LAFKIHNFCRIKVLLSQRAISYNNKILSVNQWGEEIQVMRTVEQLLQVKGSDIWSFAPQATTYNALQIMAEKNVGALLVIEKEKLMGIFSERDYARKVILKDKSSKNTPVGELMIREVFYIDTNYTLEESMALMTAKRIRHLPVLKNNQLIGIVTLGDVVGQIISDQQLPFGNLRSTSLAARVYNTSILNLRFIRLEVHKRKKVFFLFHCHRFHFSDLCRKF
jgi:CBS domain-containing protein